ncbi:RnfH family protein [Ramlibacter sp. MMS24-I3-19]|uniref:RnfH family protein n=1 Tax=Ramlibacter sp. MMS24-I3-19 TaxID=3416606 RepID=UPI003D041AA6
MAEASLRIVVVHSPGPRQVVEQIVSVAAGTTVADALRLAGVQVPADGEVGIWGRRAAFTHALRDGDRVEVARPLRVDPKVARRERFRKQGSRAAGLFAGRRPGSKAGY